MCNDNSRKRDTSIIDVAEIRQKGIKWGGKHEKCKIFERSLMLEREKETEIEKDRACKRL
jgi:hypothetical protein